MTFDDAILFLENAKVGASTYGVACSVVATQGGGPTLSGSFMLYLPPERSGRGIESTAALASVAPGSVYLSSRVTSIVVPPSYTPGETFDQPFYAGNSAPDVPNMEITISRPLPTIVDRQFVADSTAFSASSATGVVADFEVNPLPDYYSDRPKFSIRLHDLGAGYAGIGPAVDGSAVGILYAIALNGVMIPE